jgi:putative transposase
MVRAAVVSHPSKWPFSGYNEIQEPRRKNVLIYYERLQVFFRADSYDQLRTTHKGWVEEQIQGAGKKRQNEWTSSIAVGSKAFVEEVKARLRFRAKGRDVIDAGEGYQLRGNLSSYKALFGVENEDIDLKNTYFWDAKSV